MSNKHSPRVREETQTGCHCGRDIQRLKELERKLNVIGGAIKRLDLGLNFVTDPQATRAEVERGENPRIPLSAQRQARVDASNSITRLEQEADILLEAVGVEQWINRN